MNLIYINSGDSSVMEAQVVSLLNYYIEHRFFANIYLLQGFANSQEKQVLEQKLNLTNFTIIWFRTYPNYSFFDFFNIRSLGFVLKKNKSIICESVIHVRGEKYGAYAYKLLKKNQFEKKLLVDIRGVSYEEILYYYNGNTLFKRNKLNGAKRSLNSLKNSCKITVVSNTLKKYLLTHFNYHKEYLYINANIAGELFKYNKDLRYKTREKLGIQENEIVAIFLSAGAANWQKEKDIVNQLQKLGIRILNLSAKKIDCQNIINLYVPFNSVHEYLSAADLGILWRDNNLVNNVASPSKFSEFICNGLPIVHNGTVDLVTDFIQKESAGIILNQIYDFTSENILHLKSINRTELSIKGRKSFGIEQIANSYRSLYEQ